MTGTNVRVAAAVLAVTGLAGAALAFGEKAMTELKDKTGNAIGRIELDEAVRRCSPEVETQRPAAGPARVAHS